LSSIRFNETLQAANGPTHNLYAARIAANRVIRVGFGGHINAVMPNKCFVLTPFYLDLLVGP
jgi:hypothetical protein